MTYALESGIPDLACIDQFAVYTGNTIGRGMPVKHQNATTIVECSAATDDCIGIAYTNEDGDWPAAAGEKVNVVRLGSPVVCPVKVAAAGCTAHAHVVCGSGGIVDIPTSDPDGTTTCSSLGRTLETGVSGDLVGVYLGQSKTIDYTP
jgi:hypothetical protein